MLWSELSGRAYDVRLINGEAGVAVGKDVFVALLAAALDRVPVDENWYLAANHDVRSAVESGGLSSARAHFVNHGYFEGRLPYRVLVDEAWYLDQNRDVAEAVAAGGVASGQAHFETSGAREGRLPHPGFSFFR